MQIDFEKEHEILFSGPSLDLGKVHWYILKADTLIREASTNPKLDSEIRSHESGIRQFVRSDKYVTEFGKRVRGHEIQWWIFQQETNHSELKQKTLIILEKIKTLREDAKILKTENPKSYSEILQIINKFTDSHKDEIKSLCEYVEWLSQKDPRAPVILFSKESKWSDSEMADRTFSVNEQTVEEKPKGVQHCTEIALGFKTRLGLVRDQIFRRMDSDLSDSLDAEIRHTRRLDSSLLTQNIAREVFEQFILYIKRMRDSLDCIHNCLLKFDSEPFVVRSFFVDSCEKKKIRFGLVQLNYS